MAPGIPGFAKEVSMNSWLTWGYWYMFLLLKELLPPDGLPARTHPLGRGVFNETPSHDLAPAILFLFFFCFITIFVSSHIYPENPEGTQVIYEHGIWYIYPTLPWIGTRNLFRPQVHADSSRPQWQTFLHMAYSYGMLLAVFNIIIYYNLL